MEDIHTCGDGRAADLTNDNCDARFVPMTPEQCAAMIPPQVQDGIGGCGDPDSTADCEILNPGGGDVWNPATSVCEAAANCDATSTTRNADTNMCECRAGFQNLNTNDDPQTCEPIPQPDDSTTTQTTPESSGNAKDAAYIGAGVFVVGAAAVFLSGGAFPIFTFNPDFGYRITESGYAANIGGRFDFRKDGWHLYANASQTNANGEFGEFRYVSGGVYTADLWKATFSESVQGETADYDFRLSAEIPAFAGMVKLNPQFAIDSEYDRKKNEWQTTNSFRINGEMRYDNWRFSANTDTERFRFNAVRRF